MSPYARLALVATGVVTALAVARWQWAGRFVEEPDFVVETRAGDYEIRRYAPCVRAETTVHDPRPERAANEGFRRLAGYIFGGNRAGATVDRSGPLTARPRGERIAMTAPVTQAPREGAWELTFTLPRGRDLESLPAPNDPRVTLRALPARRVAVLRYRGRSGPAAIAAGERALRAWLTARGIEPVGDATSARYDPPSTLPWLRRNEVWLALDAAG